MKYWKTAHENAVDVCRLKDDEADVDDLCFLQFAVENDRSAVSSDDSDSLPELMATLIATAATTNTNVSFVVCLLALVVLL